VLLFQVGKCNIVIGGDATEEMWEALYKKWGGFNMKIHLLKASHHGRKSGYYREIVKAMNPDVTILSYASEEPTYRPRRKRDEVEE